MTVSRASAASRTTVRSEERSAMSASTSLAAEDRIATDDAFGLGAGVLRTHEPRDEDAQRVQSNHGRGEDGLRHHVTSRRDDGGDDEDDQKRVLEVLQQ